MSIRYNARIRHNNARIRHNARAAGLLRPGKRRSVPGGFPGRSFHP